MTLEEMMFALRARHIEYCEVLEVHGEEVEGAASWEVFDGDERLFFGAYDQPDTPLARRRPFGDVLLLALTFPSIELPMVLHQTSVRFRQADDYNVVLCEDGAMTQVFWVDPDGGPQFEVWLSQWDGEGWEPYPMTVENPMGDYWQEAYNKTSQMMMVDQQIEKISWGLSLMNEMGATHNMRMNPQAVEGRIHRLPTMLGVEDE